MLLMKGRMENFLGLEEVLCKQIKTRLESLPAPHNNDVK